MQADTVWRRRTGSRYRKSEGYRCPAGSRCVDGCLKPLSLSLSLTPPDPNRGWSNQAHQRGRFLDIFIVVRRATMHYMSHPLSLRLNDATIARLGRHAQRAHLAPRTLAQRYVEEGLRMDEHPLIRFADGPAGRRARLVGTGKDVWEIIAVVRDNDGHAAETARYLEIPLGLVQAAISYYGAYREEIDQWIEANEQQAAEAHAAWSAGQDAVRP
jgi:uncharacterized protein (DUF433 family)